MLSNKEDSSSSQIESDSEVEDVGNDKNSTQEEECNTNWHILWPVKRRSHFRIHRKSIHITLKFFVILNRIVFIFFLLRMKYSKLLRIKRIYMLRK